MTALQTVDDFTIPAPADAIAWSAAILGELRPVAEAFQVAYAETIAADAWQFAGETILPFGPTLEELRSILAGGRSDR